MLTERFSSTWFNVELNSATHGGNRHAIVIETQAEMLGATFDWRNKFKVRIVCGNNSSH